MYAKYRPETSCDDTEQNVKSANLGEERGLVRLGYGVLRGLDIPVLNFNVIINLSFFIGRGIISG